eukprot:gene29832-39576_t
MASFFPQHIISIRDLSIEYVIHLLQASEHMRKVVENSGGDESLKNKVLASVFYEPSTRTSCSFQAAMLRLGGSVICINENHSSVKKGESLEDTIRTMASYCDVIVLRHPVKGSALVASNNSLNKPVINAGDGAGEHPTQALLDLYTIKAELGVIGGSSDCKMVVTLLGDLKFGRTVHSLAILLSNFPNIQLVYVSPAGLEMPAEIKEIVAAKHYNIEQVEAKSLDEVIGITDVLYVTRIQKERFSSEEDYNNVMGSYCVDKNVMLKAKEKMIVMHPLPRLSEISPEIDGDPRAAYFRQMEYGMFMRMAILNSLLSNSARLI